MPGLVFQYCLVSIPCGARPVYCATTAAGAACEVSDTLPYDADAALQKISLKDPEPLPSETPKRFADFKNLAASTLVLGGTEAPKARVEIARHEPTGGSEDQREKQDPEKAMKATEANVLQQEKAADTQKPKEAEESEVKEGFEGQQEKDAKKPEVGEQTHVKEGSKEQEKKDADTKEVVEEPKHEGMQDEGGKKTDQAKESAQANAEEGIKKAEMKEAQKGDVLEVPNLLAEPAKLVPRKMQYALADSKKPKKKKEADEDQKEDEADEKEPKRRRKNTQEGKEPEKTEEPRGKTRKGKDSEESRGRKAKKETKSRRREKCKEGVKEKDQKDKNQTQKKKKKKSEEEPKNEKKATQKTKKGVDNQQDSKEETLKKTPRAKRAKKAEEITAEEPHERKRKTGCKKKGSLDEQDKVAEKEDFTESKGAENAKVPKTEDKKPGSFARRFQPATQPAKNRWEAIRNCFNQIIKPQVSFWNACMECEALMDCADYKDIYEAATMVAANFSLELRQLGRAAASGHGNQSLPFDGLPALLFESIGERHHIEFISAVLLTAWLDLPEMATFEVETPPDVLHMVQEYQKYESDTWMEAGLRSVVRYARGSVRLTIPKEWRESFTALRTPLAPEAPDRRSEPAADDRSPSVVVVVAPKVNRQLSYEPVPPDNQEGLTPVATPVRTPRTLADSTLRSPSLPEPPRVDDQRHPRPTPGSLHLSQEAIDQRLRRLTSPKANGQMKISAQIVQMYKSGGKGKKDVYHMFQACGFDVDWCC
eukprot:s1080_g27.t1